MGLTSPLPSSACERGKPRHCGGTDSKGLIVTLQFSYQFTGRLNPFPIFNTIPPLPSIGVEQRCIIRMVSTLGRPNRSLTPLSTVSFLVPVPRNQISTLHLDIHSHQHSLVANEFIDAHSAQSQPLTSIQWDRSTDTPTSGTRSM